MAERSILNRTFIRFNFFDVNNGTLIDIPTKYQVKGQASSNLYFSNQEVKQIEFFEPLAIDTEATGTGKAFAFLSTQPRRFEFEIDTRYSIDTFAKLRFLWFMIVARHRIQFVTSDGWFDLSQTNLTAVLGAKAETLNYCVVNFPDNWKENARGVGQYRDKKVKLEVSESTEITLPSS